MASDRWEKLGFLIKSIPFIIIAVAFVLLYFDMFGGEEVTAFWNQNSWWMITTAVLILVLWLLYRYHKASANRSRNK